MRVANGRHIAPKLLINVYKCPVYMQGRRSHRIIGGHKKDWGSGDSNGVQGRSPGRRSGGTKSPRS